MSRPQTEGRTWRIPRTGLVAAIVTFLVLGGSGGAYAYWTAQGALTSTAKAGSIAISLAGFTSLQNTFVNDTRTKTGSVTVTNTSTSSSTTQIPVSIGLGYVAGGSGVLAANLDVTMWGPIAAASCTSTATPSGTIKTGTWASFPAMASTLSAGQAKTWCVRTSNDERSELASSSGTLTIQPKATATLTAGTWSATASSTTTQNTQYIYPVSALSATTWFRIHLTTQPTRCLDIKGSGGAGTEVIDWVCTTNPNQQFQLSGADANGYLTVTPRHAQGLRWDNGGSTAPGGWIAIQTASGTGSQAWQFQQVSPGVYQIVNKSSGLCASPGGTIPTGQPGYTQALCNGSAGQRFTLETVPTMMTIMCAETGGNNKNQDVVYSWDAADAGSYTFQADDGGWKTIGTTGAGATDITIDGSEPSGDKLEKWNQGSYNVQVLDTNNTVVGTTSITLGNKRALSCP